VLLYCDVQVTTDNVYSLIQDEVDEVVEETRLADTDHADAKGGNSAAAGADSKLVKSIMSRQAEQEAAVAATNKTNVEVSMCTSKVCPFWLFCLLCEQCCLCCRRRRQKARRSTLAVAASVWAA
jgi:hypothetical protein